MFSTKNIIEEVKKMELPLGEYVVYSGGVLAVLGLRETNDIDIAVTEKLLNELRESGEYEEYEKYGKVFLTKPGVDVASQLDWEDYPTTVEEAINTAMVIDGIPFLNIDEMIKFKKALGREKDFKDVELLEKYRSEK